jgi:hypothetical protein
VTILYPSAFYESLPAQFDGVFHWDYLDEVLRPIRNIRCADVDALVEINNMFLSIETKNPGVAIPLGQRLRTDALLRTGLVTHLDIWGKETPVAWQWRQPHPRGDSETYTDEDGRARIAAGVRKWAHWADQLSAAARDYRWLSSAWRNSCLQAREQFTYDCLNPALGGLAGTPLGQAAVARAESLRRP